MRVFEFFREKSQKLQKTNAEFMAKIQPQFKDLSDKVTQKFVNSLNNPWISLFKQDDGEDDEPQQLVLSPQAAKAYGKLQESLGEETFVGDWFEVSQDCINQFANVTGDQQWIHTDQEKAELESPFKTTIAHGFLTLSLIPMLTDTVSSESNPYPDAKMVVNYGLNQVRFPFPVKSGSRVRARSRLIGLTPMKRSVEVINEVSIEVENSKRLACVAETVVRLYF